MRVIAGKAKGYRLSAPKGYEVRPTSDRAKEAVFNILGEKTSGAAVLDLFAGTGSLGIEALSRGAETAVFIEHDSRAVRSILANVQKTLFESETQVIETSAKKALQLLKSQEKQFDLIFLDPPYKIDLAELETILSSIVEFNLLNKSGLIIVEHSSRINLSVPEKLKQAEPRKYGDTAWSILESKN